jgi:hypothetical protein
MSLPTLEDCNTLPTLEDSIPTDCCLPEEDPGPQPTKCDLDRNNNVWVEGIAPDGTGGICTLDNLCDDTIVFILQRDEHAREDLLRVTSDAHLRTLAATTPRLPTTYQGDEEMAQINQMPASIPFYTAFRGQPPFAQ